MPLSLFVPLPSPFVKDKDLPPFPFLHHLCHHPYTLKIRSPYIYLSVPGKKENPIQIYNLPRAFFNPFYPHKIPRNDTNLLPPCLHNGIRKIFFLLGKGNHSLFIIAKVFALFPFSGWKGSLLPEKRKNITPYRKI